VKPKNVYLLFAVIGFVGPYFFFISFLATHGLDGRAFLQELFASNISTFFAVDLMVSSVVFIGYLRVEATRCSIDRWWLYLIALLTVGLSFALPLFLYVRERRLESRTSIPEGRI
jgi:hypothetical protein